MAAGIKSWLLRLMSAKAFVGKLVGGLEGEDHLAVQVAADLRQWTLEGRLSAVWTKIPHEVGACSPKSPSFRVSQARYAKQLAMGLVTGSADYVFTWMHGSGGGWIELKRAVGGSLSPEQRDFRDWCVTQGVRYATCRSRAEVKATLIEWGCLRD